MTLRERLVALADGISPPASTKSRNLAERQLVLAAAQMALEDAVQACDRRYMGDNNREDMEARRCAAAIRALRDGLE